MSNQPSDSRGARAAGEPPADVAADPSLSRAKKLETLDTLEQDARQLSTAAAEGMEGGEVSKLHEVLTAKNSLDPAAPKAQPRPGSAAEVEAELETEKLDP